MTIARLKYKSYTEVLNYVRICRYNNSNYLGLWMYCREISQRLSCQLKPRHVFFIYLFFLLYTTTDSEKREARYCRWYWMSNAMSYPHTSYRKPGNQYSKWLPNIIRTIRFDSERVSCIVGLHQ